jgi:hypothetical protein
MCPGGSSQVNGRSVRLPPSVVTSTNSRVIQVTKIVQVLAAAVVVFAFVTPMMAVSGEQLASQVEKKLETQIKDLTRNWGG